MEPVTHVLTGALISRTGLNRRAAYCTAAMAIGAELPDIDTLWSIEGPLASFQHHRGITHTFVGIPFEAATVTLAFYLYHRLRKQPKTAAPARWAELFAYTLLALLSHLFLDWTNNYGLRPFFPFDPHWYAGSFVFIFEPILFLFLLIGLLAPSLFGLIGSEVGARKPPFSGRAWPTAALLAICALWLFRFNQHAEALTLAARNAPEATRVYASPHPIDPFTWHIVADTPDHYQLSTLDTHTQHFDPTEPSDTLYKPAITLPLLAAKRTGLGRIYLDWSQYPILIEAADTTDPNHPLAVVTFTDARFLYNTFLVQGRTHAPINGQVTLNMQAPDGQRVIETRMGNKIQR
ncbi:metal-dependent hydrolase [Granulicella tundricola]|uniref:Membrane-bound metal-dependent hydrolase n=1 Tax=Granulicella tundricola (strain ATCC BAA-1859 / DSM 23138 / MP5ACTX9) TaxID=1198114 RepID=E8X4W7_GRATM|nr:metal-dependent hydrolase [Granulicella tundricola]ADW70606.1 membrane-bound metal-dependent hydrolase [Granulicella tundricola MP5ACTX9]